MAPRSRPHTRTAPRRSRSARRARSPTWCGRRVSWASSEPTLEAAQEAKLELTCQKLALQPGERVLDVGCGWGSFAIHAAQRHGANVVGITLSEAQARLARRRVAEVGLADRVEIRHMD